MEFESHVLTFTIGLFVGILAFLEIGRHLGARRLARDPEEMRVEVSAVEGALFGLLASS